MIIMQQMKQTRMIPPKRTYLHWSILMAKNKQGRVMISPTDVMRGAVTLSGSHPLRKLWIAITKVIARMNMLDSNPPITEITTKSMMEIEWNPQRAAAVRESMPKKQETIMVRKRDAVILSVTRGDFLNPEISPMCNAVLMRDPREAKIFPRIPMAAGTMMISPGRNSRVLE
jgi:hypothetical protein